MHADDSEDLERAVKEGKTQCNFLTNGISETNEGQHKTWAASEACQWPVTQ